MNNQQFESLLKEYELHRNELHLRFDHRIKGLTFILSAVIIAFGLGLKDNITQIFIVIPWFFIGLFAYFSNQTICTFMTLNYLEYLEQAIGYIAYERRIVSHFFRKLLTPV
jgi:hypothetical protein